VTAIPTLLIFKNGQVVEQMVGAKSKRDLKASLDKAPLNQRKIFSPAFEPYGVKLRLETTEPIAVRRIEIILEEQSKFGSAVVVVPNGSESISVTSEASHAPRGDTYVIPAPSPECQIFRLLLSWQVIHNSDRTIEVDPPFLFA
jgi:hypothetical protein